MADCYYHGYSGSGGACSYCESEERNNQPAGSSGGRYEPIPMEILDKFNEIKYKDTFKKISEIKN